MGPFLGKVVAVSLACLIAGGALLAQQIQRQTIDEQRYYSDLLMRQLLDSPRPADTERVERQAQARAHQTLIEKMNAFSIEFNALGKEFEAGPWNVDRAAKAVKAWKNLTSDPGWIAKKEKRK